MQFNVLDYAWHQAHSYRLMALPANFTYVRFKPLVWNVNQRPIPNNFMGALEPEEVNSKDYDFALLHLDQWCDRDNLRALPFRLMKQITKDIPQIVIMHGTPDDEKNRKQILQLINGLPVVCNSEEAAKQWDGGEARFFKKELQQFSTIIHGYSMEEFFNHPIEKRNNGDISISSGGSMSYEYHGIPILQKLVYDVGLKFYGPMGNHRWCSGYWNYRDMLASSLIYVNPSRRGPMPGARTEAMFSGCCVVTVPGNDIENYITNGVDGFIVDSYEDMLTTIRGLLDNPDWAYQIGQKGRETARNCFNKTRFVNDWTSFLGRVL